VSNLDELSRRILEFLAQNGEHVIGEILIAVKDLVTDREKVRYRLFTLAAEGLVERRKLTPKLSMWKLTEKGRKVIEEQQRQQ
jgi:DNA-binding Lrp family transcriptional regulator